MRTRVYVSGPYSDNPPMRAEQAIAVGQKLLKAGYAPMVPHLTHYWEDLHYRNSYDEWLELDLAWVEAADAVLLLPGKSPGADQEVALAHRLKIPVFASVTALRVFLPADRSALKAAWKPELPDSVQTALDRATATFAKKNQDYASDTDWRSNFDDIARQMGTRAVDAANTLIAVKQARLKSLQDNGRGPTNEAVDDTYLDRMVYSIIAYALLLDDTEDS